MAPRYTDRRRKLVTERDLDRGVLLSERYQLGSSPHRDPDEGPAILEYGDDGSLRAYSYYVKGKAHREGGPAHVVFGPNGVLLEESYSQLGKFHRDPDEGPAHVVRNEQGVVTQEWYVFYRKHYRDPGAGPMQTFRRDDGTVEKEEYAKPDAKRPKRPNGWNESLATLKKPLP